MIEEISGQSAVEYDRKAELRAKIKGYAVIILLGGTAGWLIGNFCLAQPWRMAGLLAVHLLALEKISRGVDRMQEKWKWKKSTAELIKVSAKVLMDIAFIATALALRIISESQLGAISLVAIGTTALYCAAAGYALYQEWNLAKGDQASTA